MGKKCLIKDDIIAMVCRDTWVPQATVRLVLNSTLSNIVQALSRGKEVQFAGFGSFEPKQRAARVGRNPHKNTPVPIPARVVPVFKAGKTFKDAVIKQGG